MSRARSITAALGGRWGGSYGAARCPAHKDRTPSLQISDADNDDDILVHCFGGCDFRDVRDALRAAGLLPEFRAGQVAPRRQPRPRNIGPDPEKLAAIEHAKKIWVSSLPAVGTHVESYLRARGITLPVPPTIRFNPSLLHKATGVLFPTMVVGLSGADKKISGVQRIYLRFDGLAKAPVAEPKMSLGRWCGDAARLGPAEETTGVCEGVETGLSAMQIYGGPVWAACGGGVNKIALPDVAKHVRVYADSGERGEEIAAKACAAFRAQGRAVTLINPPSECGDFNDVLNSQTTAKEAAA